LRHDFPREFFHKVRLHRIPETCHARFRENCQVQRSMDDETQRRTSRPATQSLGEPSVPNRNGAILRFWGHPWPRGRDRSTSPGPSFRLSLPHRAQEFGGAVLPVPGFDRNDPKAHLSCLGAPSTTFRVPLVLRPGCPLGSPPKDPPFGLINAFPLFPSIGGLPILLAPRYFLLTAGSSFSGGGESCTPCRPVTTALSAGLSAPCFRRFAGQDFCTWASCRLIPPSYPPRRDLATRPRDGL